MTEKKHIAVIGIDSHRSALAEALIHLHGIMDSQIIGSNMHDYYELYNIVRDLPLVYDDGKHHRNKHKETCAKNRAKRKSKKRKKR